MMGIDLDVEDNTFGIDWLPDIRLKFHDQQGATIRFCWASLRLNQVRSDYIVFRRLNARV